MGNRAVITFAKKSEVEKYIKDGKEASGFVADNPHRVGIYLHWNGGRTSVEGFLETCKRLEFRCGTEDCYGVARLTQVVCNFFGGTDGLSVGVDTLDRLDTDNYDNGVYIVGEGWQIVGREFTRGAEDEKPTKKEIKEFADNCVAIQKGVDKTQDNLRAYGRP